MKIRRQDMDEQYQITKSSGSSQKQIVVFIIRLPNFFVLFRNNSSFPLAPSLN